MVAFRCGGGGEPTDFKCGVSYDVETRPVTTHTSNSMTQFFFFFSSAPVASAPRSTAAMKAYCTSPALEVPACTTRSPHAYDARDL
jgi:hypothetical protein